jgi:hypothetical protein
MSFCGAAPDAGTDGGSDGGNDSGTPDAGTDGGGCVNLAFVQTGPYVFDSGSRPVNVRAGDLNGDGWPDLVAVDNGLNVVQLLWNQRDGGFVVSSVAVGNAPSSAALGDFNRDGKLDIAVANSGDSTITVLTNQGDGGFSAATVLSPGGAFGVAAGDWNADGWPDAIVTTSAGGTVNLFFNDAGSLVFAASADAGSLPRACALATIMSDGGLEALVLGQGDGLLHVLANAGDAGFGAQASFPAANTPVGLAVGALTQPGSQDVAVVYQGTAINVLQNDAGSFSPWASFSVGAASAVRIADVTSDGRADMVVGLANANPGFIVFLRDGGGFTQVPVPSSQANDLDVADFNRDGLPDVATADLQAGQVFVYLNACTP